MPEDWHTLLNAQAVYKERFLDAGLLNFASKMGFTESSAVGALSESSNFRRNHLFLIETYEAVLRVQLKHFLSARKYDPDALQEIENLEPDDLNPVCASQVSVIRTC